MKKIILLGCSGSIGTTTINLIRKHPSLFQLVGLSAHTNEKLLLQYAKEFGVKNYVLTSNENANFLLDEMIQNTNADIVLNAIAGSSGLYPSISTLKCKKDLALANKETIVMAGKLIKKLAQKNNCKIIPVDSEHSAVFALINNFGSSTVKSVILTASGGPFRLRNKEDFSTITLKEALAHPSWSMGKKITIDSATLANKGLEVIEASLLFDLPSEQIQVVVHPESYVHSLISTKDNILYAQISKPDMSHPIFYALSYPHCTANNLDHFDITKGLQLNFFEPDFKKFPMLALAYQALDKGDAYTIVYNAINEIAVDLFVQGKISFIDIAKLTEKTLSKNWNTPINNFETVFEIDKEVREIKLI
ncbi:MAG: 1-deoxy-D-xylulose-5-phosphate reductoisomerase [Treponemataceae bacterium]